MARRSAAADAIPSRLLTYRVQDWPSVAAWWQARRDYRAARPPASLAELNATWYAPDRVWPLMPDPREVPYGA